MFFVTSFGLEKLKFEIFVLLGVGTLAETKFLFVTWEGVQGNKGETVFEVSQKGVRGGKGFIFVF